jgi:hypothetical protein
VARWVCVLALLGYAAPTTGLEVKADSMPDGRTRTAVDLMAGFADRTGLTSEHEQRRYLWTDGFAVCNFIGLSRTTGDEGYGELALQLVDRVHHVLGRHRSDDPRTGWISGLDDREGEKHPTRGGLRIGKPLGERAAGEAFDERLEWDRDGQYFHYLTRWMHALDLVARSTRQPRFNVWARELARTAHAAFVHQPTAGSGSRMYWKMSIDLSRPLVSSMGLHDPLDGLVTLVQLGATASDLSGSAEGPDIGDQVTDFASMVKDRDWTTPDPLGIGGLLMDALLVEQLMRRGVFPEGRLLEDLLGAARTGLQHFARGGELDRPAAMRLAFRELGLAIGLHAVERLSQATLEHPGRPEVRARLEDLMRHVSLRERIESFWLDSGHRRAPSWSEHQDINEVMLATSLAPDGCLVLPPID